MKIDEIAKLAGVSKTTVSRVLNNRPDVNNKTRNLVLQVIEEQGYKPNAMAKAISLKRSHTIGMIIPYEAEYIFSNPYYVEVMRGVYTEADKQGYTLMICYPHNHNYMEMFKKKLVEGYILISPGNDHQYILQALIDGKAPFVSTSNVIGWDTKIDVVDVDNYSGGRQMTEYLYDMGHRHIAYLGKSSITSSMERLKGYRDVLLEKDIEYDTSLVYIIKNGSIPNAEFATTDLMSRHPEMTAIFAASDMLAMGAIKSIKGQGKKVPDDISVVGFDDIPIAQHHDPALTTMRQPAYGKGVESVKMLINKLEEKSGTENGAQHKLMSMELIERNSAIRLDSKEQQ